MAERHDHHKLCPGLLGQALHPLDADTATADVELLEDHNVPGERARLVCEEVRDKAELLVDVGRVAPGRHVPLVVVQLQVPPEELKGPDSIGFFRIIKKILKRSIRRFFVLFNNEYELS